MPIEQLSASDLSDDLSQFGLQGSPTWVDEIFSLETSRLGAVIRDTPPDEAVAQLMDFLEERGVFSGEASAGGRVAIPRGPRIEGGERGAIWAHAEIMRGEVRPVTLELLGRARQIAPRIGAAVEAILIGDTDVTRIRTLTAYGADRVHVVSDRSLLVYDIEAHTTALAAAIEAESPFAVLMPSTTNTRDLAARVAARLGLGLTGDCVGLDIDDEGRLSQLKPAFGGSIVAPILSRTLPNMATVRPGILTACDPDWSMESHVNHIDTDNIPNSSVIAVRDVSDMEPDAADLESASRIVAVGKGIGGPEHLGPIRELADVLGASLGATRDITDLGWLPRQRQIGLSGKAVAPELYIAVGLRGPFNHTVGIQRSGTVVRHQQ